MSTPPAPPGYDASRWADEWAQARAELAEIAAEVAEDERLSRPGVFKAELDDVVREAVDPELHGVVVAARQPLVIDWDKPLRHRTRPHPTPSSLRLAKMTKLRLPADVLAEIEAHAASAGEDFEAGGRLVIADGVAQSYVPVANLSTEPRKFSTKATWWPRGNECGLVVHSHPASCSPAPSEADLAYALRLAWPMFGVWHPDAGLGVWRPHPNGRSAVRVPVQVVAPRRSAQPRGRFSFSLRATSSLRASAAIGASDRDEPLPAKTTASDYIDAATAALIAAGGGFTASGRRW